MPQPQVCSNCGAMMEPQADGRTHVCPYCRTTLQAAIDASQLAAGIQLDLQNLEASLAKAAQTLCQAVPDQARAQWQDQWLMLLEVELGKDKFIAVREGRQLLLRHQKIVRGVALKTTTLAADQWWKTLMAALAASANENARAAQALQQLR